MKPEKIPQDINAETFLSLFPSDTFNVKFCGLHKHNTYKDILDIEDAGDKLSLSLSCNSLYNSLPEYIFHSIDRFDHIPQNNKKEKFQEEYAKQEREKEKAYAFFAPLDTLLFQLRLNVKERLSQYVESNTLIQNIILDGLSDSQKENRFIKRTIPYITSCKSIRGNKTLITLLLRKIFFDEGIRIHFECKSMSFTDQNPRYDESVGNDLDALYVGNTFDEQTMTYTIDYWSDDECDDKFLDFINEVNVYRQFIQDCFFSVDAILNFEISKDAPTIRLSDTTVYNYLNYNTNI